MAIADAGDMAGRGIDPKPDHIRIPIAVVLVAVEVTEQTCTRRDTVSETTHSHVYPKAAAGEQVAANLTEAYRKATA